MRHRLIIACFIFCTACIRQPRCYDYRPGLPTAFSDVEVVRGDSTGVTSVTVVVAPAAQIELIADNGTRLAIDSATVATPWVGGRSHLRVRKTGYRPADTTVVLTPGAHSEIRVRLLSLIVVTPPLKVCEP